MKRAIDSGKRGSLSDKFLEDMKTAAGEAYNGVAMGGRKVRDRTSEERQFSAFLNAEKKCKAMLGNGTLTFGPPTHIKPIEPYQTDLFAFKPIALRIGSISPSCDLIHSHSYRPARSNAGGSEEETARGRSNLECL